MSSQRQWHRRRKAEKEQERLMEMQGRGGPTILTWIRRKIKIWKRKREGRKWR